MAFPLDYRAGCLLHKKEQAPVWKLALRKPAGWVRKWNAGLRKVVFAPEAKPFNEQRTRTLENPATTPCNHWEN